MRLNDELIAAELRRLTWTTPKKVAVVKPLRPFTPADVVFLRSININPEV